uniref:T-complex protein 1 subunit eta n=1 Tax=Chaetoceros debilis TaxID=122233 RepID=A0A7S3Q2L2_9STRA|mmetsp:Transcript_24937/g.36868  ORF Transcript_24937/g.36868 Transcript_24937/m.36868 type:complete len:585 (+) Transcript_24937:93-1847(+)|eukprot:CAMPEP_0194080548 /NCGR_PEP_ID=MMETSP0149-20130528/6546_1 /TAXON_ID=122233 /ORGANISM="Chaetoceros debilis, Strain MM31A-1" /LENGTH=584 /DNA_ID=CAMNT_0038762295 /DNA_START=52 /DNA_END=1806 /DNA_ORIENTATION=+
MAGRPGIIILREGTDTSQGKAQLISNINACQAVADVVKTTLGPRGMDKLIFDGRRVTISNDGATIMRLLEVAHPAAKTLVDISMSQDAEVGDGTTSVVLLAGAMLKSIKPFVEEGVHPQVIIRNVKTAARLAVEKVMSLSVPYDTSTKQGEEMLLKCASTSLNSKLISGHQDLFSPMIVMAVKNLHENNALDDLRTLIAIKKIPGGDVRSSFLVQGVAFKKTFSYAGFEQMTKKFTNPKILLLNVELELKSEKENAEVRITDPEQYQSIVDAEWQVIYDKLDACVDCGANIVLSKLPVGDLATQYFADRGLFCAGRVEDSDLKRVCKATGGTVQTTTNGLFDGILGTCGKFEERQVGDERFNVFEECPQNLTSTMVLRGGSEQFIAESERSIHDALMVVKRCLKSNSVVAGGGAVEMEISKYLKEYALTIEGKGQLIISAFAKSLEVVPQQLCDNAGFDATDILSALRRKHAMDEDGTWYGVDIEAGSICDTFESGVWEPSDNKRNSLGAAAEAACVILSIDETVVNPRSQDPGGAGQQQQMQQQKPMSNMMGNAMDAVNAQHGGSRSGNLGNGVSYLKGRGGG